jgi:hypothetical protein
MFGFTGGFLNARRHREARSDVAIQTGLPRFPRDRNDSSKAHYATYDLHGGQ